MLVGVMSVEEAGAIEAKILLNLADLKRDLLAAQRQVGAFEGELLKAEKGAGAMDMTGFGGGDML
jgi:hypothetical protein